MDKHKLLVTSIQRFSLHDGPGIRTVVFFKGCLLHCPWCANPENISLVSEKYIKDNYEGWYGEYYSCEELIAECIKDKLFYCGRISRHEWAITSANQIEDLPGGITFSGGECLIQMKKLIPLCDYLKKNDIHIAAETSLFCSSEQLSYAMEWIDLFYVDFKIIDERKCAEITGGNLPTFLENLERLFLWSDANGRKKPVIARIPVIGTYTDDVCNRTNLIKLIWKYRDRILKVELIKEHNLAESKYKSLNRMMNYHGVDDELMQLYKTELERTGLPIEICSV